MIIKTRRHLEDIFWITKGLVFVALLFVIAWTIPAGAAEETKAKDASGDEPFVIDPETARLKIDRVDFEFKNTPVVTRVFRRLQKDRGIFGPLWCSNLDLRLTDVEVSQPAMITLHDCSELGVSQNSSRRFRKVLDAWVEENSASRILKKPDGRWEQTEFPHAVFRADGLLESFNTTSRMRWTLRRDSNSVLISLDNLKGESVKFRRNLAGDLDALVLARGKKTLVQYRLSTLLESAQVAGRTEAYEYDTDGNIFKVLLTESGRTPRLWRLSYMTPEWVSAVLHPDGCTSKWTYAKVGDDAGGALRASETRNCPRRPLLTATPPSPRPSAKPLAPEVKEKPSFGLASTPARVPSPSATPRPQQVMIKRVGPLGMGEEKAQVTLNREGFPVLFEIVGSDQKVRRLEIEREEISGSTLLIRSKDTEVSFKKRPREYDAKQLDLLDEYETWMATWGDR